MLNSFKFSALVLALLLSFPATSQRKETKQWYKGNLHTHSYWSDGDEYPEMILDWYKTRNYDFVALSDHNTMAREEKWIKVVKSRMYEEAFQKYLTRFGADWVTHKTDSGRTLVKLKTYPEYKQKMEGPGFLIIPAEEITDRYEGKPLHMGGINLQHVVTPQGGSSVTETLQRNIDAVLKQRKETGVTMFPHINHPNFFYAITAQDMIGLHGERFFEVYNGHPMVHNEGDSLHSSTEALWDEINIAYSKRGQPLLLGLGTDDSHSYHQFGTAYSNAGRGWVMVYSHALKPQSLIEALERGDFYASSGVMLKDVSLNKKEIVVEVQEEAGVKYTIEFVGVMKGAEKSVVLARVNGSKAKFQVTDKHLFVRARITSTKVKSNPYRDEEVEMAWTQPVGISN
jgi:hypothetical protein